MIEIKEPAKLKLKLFGEEFNLLKPTRKQVVDMQAQLRTDEGKEMAFDIIGQFLVDSGLPQEKVDSLQLEHQELILNSLVGVKKN